MKPSKESFNEVERIRRETFNDTWKPKTQAQTPDPYDMREHARDLIHNRCATPENHHWRRVMEFHGFKWCPPEVLNRTIGPKQVGSSLQRQVLLASELEQVKIWKDPLTGKEVEGLVTEKPHMKGQWRRTKPTPEAFEESDLLALFTGPENFDEWIRRHTDTQLHGVKAVKKHLSNSFSVL